MKKILYLFLVLPLIFSSCKKDDDNNSSDYSASDMIGTWQATELTLDGVDQTQLVNAIVFQMLGDMTYEQGILLFDNSELYLSGSWDLDGSSLTLYPEEGGYDIWEINSLTSSEASLTLVEDVDIEGNTENSSGSCELTRLE